MRSSVNLPARDLGEIEQLSSMPIIVPQSPCFDDLSSFTSTPTPTSKGFPCSVTVFWSFLYCVLCVSTPAQHASKFSPSHLTKLDKARFTTARELTGAKSGILLVSLRNKTIAEFRLVFLEFFKHDVLKSTNTMEERLSVLDRQQLSRND
jgi:hypothetical protein